EEYKNKKIFEKSPFEVLDRDGVGQLMKMAVEKGRMSKQDLEIGICGEHGGESSSIEFCESIGLNYVSCSPYRVTIAILSAAQSTIKNKK
ncbi:MAG: putative PEP-binding protein, partial [Fusobacteriaceae bacterium]